MMMMMMMMMMVMMMMLECIICFDIILYYVYRDLESTHKIIIYTKYERKGKLNHQWCGDREDQSKQWIPPYPRFGSTILTTILSMPIAPKLTT